MEKHTGQGIIEYFNMLLIAFIGHYQDVFIANEPKSFSIYNNYNYNYNYNYSDYEFPINSFKFGLSFGYRF